MYTCLFFLVEASVLPLGGRGQQKSGVCCIDGHSSSVMNVKFTSWLSDSIYPIDFFYPDVQSQNSFPITFRQSTYSAFSLDGFLWILLVVIFITYCSFVKFIR